MLISPCSVRPPDHTGSEPAQQHAALMQILTRDKKKNKNATICHRKSLSVFFNFLSQRALFLFPRRARGLIQTYSSAYLLLRLPLLSPPISSRANSELICNSLRRRNWCLILALGNRIMWVREEEKKKETERKREGERQEKKDKHFDMRNRLLHLDYFFFHTEGGNPS